MSTIAPVERPTRPEQSRPNRTGTTIALLALAVAVAAIVVAVTGRAGPGGGPGPTPTTVPPGPTTTQPAPTTTQAAPTTTQAGPTTTVATRPALPDGVYAITVHATDAYVTGAGMIDCTTTCTGASQPGELTRLYVRPPPAGHHILWENCPTPTNGDGWCTFQATSDLDVTARTLPTPQLADAAGVNYGPETGGTRIAVRGELLGVATQMSIGGQQATGFTVVSENLLAAVTPAGIGLNEIAIDTPVGVKTNRPPFVYTSPNVGVPAGLKATTTDFGPIKEYKLTWDPVPGAVQYAVYGATGVRLGGGTIVSTTSWDTIVPGSFRVFAIDAGGHYSEPSAPFEIKP